MKFLVAAYRAWAQDAFQDVREIHPSVQLELALTAQDLERKALQEWDAIVLVGWSWIVSSKILAERYVVCYHPTDLPAYAGGTPIQHQVTDGITRTRASLFRVTPQIDAGPVLYKTDLSLEGHIEDIFFALRKSSVELVSRFINDWPNVVEVPQTSKSNPLRRLKPGDGMLTRDDLGEMTCKQLYDFVRCREEPYPNAFIEDETGKLFIERVRFSQK